MAGWQWHGQIICASLQTDNRASTSSLDFLQAGWSFWHPTISVKATTMLCAAAAENLRWLSAFKASCKGPRVGHPRLPTPASGNEMRNEYYQCTILSCLKLLCVFVGLLTLACLSISIIEQAQYGCPTWTICGYIVCTFLILNPQHILM